MENQIEIFKPIKGFETSHEVSNFGQVRSKDRIIQRINGKSLPLKARFIRSWVSSGYEQVTINNRNHFLVHRLVAEAFLVHTEKQIQVNHIDCNKLNNHINNLEWCTPSENKAHALKSGRYNKGSMCKHAKLTEKDIPEIFKMRLSGLSCLQIGTTFGVDLALIARILNRKAWKHVTVTLSLILCVINQLSYGQIGKPNQDTVKCYGFTELRYIAATLVEARACDTLLAISKAKLANRDFLVKEKDYQLSKVQTAADLKDALLKMKDDDNIKLTKDLKKEKLRHKFTKFGWASSVVVLSAAVVYFIIK